MRRRLARPIIAAVLAVVFSASVCVANVPEPYPGPDVTAGTMVFDLTIARPLGLVAMVFGAAALLVSIPFTWPTGSVDETAQMLVVAPTKYTFQRPLGQLGGPLEANN